MEVSVVIPTYNEAANVPVLLRGLAEALDGISYEALVVDDNSPDGTADAARQAGARTIVRTEERGLATAVIEGFRQARGDFVVVMDADLQHPPEMVAKLLAEARDGADLVIGSRYVDGGSDGAFSTVRRVISRGARLVGKLALPPLRRFGLTDPMSGLFLVRRSRVDPEALRPVGYKILLEVIGRSHLDDVREVGFAFGHRNAGESKLGASVMVQYLMHLATLALSDPENRRMARFAAVGLTGVFVNLGLLWTLTEGVGLHYLASALLAIEASIISNFLLNDRFTFHDKRDGTRLGRLARFNAVSLGALVINLAVLATFTELLHVHYLASEAIAIVAAFSANYAGNTQWTYGGVDRFRLRDVPRKVQESAGIWLPTLVVAGVALGAYAYELDEIREVYFDEHYYLSVAKQLENGILHDPCWEGSDAAPRPLNYEHPPLAKLIMGWSVANFDSNHEVFEGCRDPSGDSYQEWLETMRLQGDPYAWRLPGAVMGAVTVAAMAVTGRRLFGSGGDWMVGGLTLADVMLVSASRTAILDIYATGFAAAAIAAATFPRKRALLAAGILLGLGFASKYSVLFVGIPVVLVAAWSHHRAGNLTRRRFDGILATIIATPFFVWLLSYLPWLRQWAPDMGLRGAFVHLYGQTRDAIDWMLGGQQVHDYASSPASWILIQRPMLFYADAANQDLQGQVYAFGNPVVWWGAMAVVAATLVRLVLARRKPSLGPMAIAIVLPVLVYGSFFLLTRTAFIFYMTLVSPFLALAAGAGVLWLARRGVIGRSLAAVAMALALGAFAWYYPLAAGVDLDPGALQQVKDSIPGAKW